MAKELKLRRRLESPVDLPEIFLIGIHGIMCIIIEDSLMRRGVGNERYSLVIYIIQKKCFS